MWRSQLRAQVVEISGNQCEHPILDAFGQVTRCKFAMAEMAHIFPRGMGHKGARDVLTNVMAACELHARSTDDLSSTEWHAVAIWAEALPGREEQKAYRSWLTQYVNQLRASQGWATPVKGKDQ